MQTNIGEANSLSCAPLQQACVFLREPFPECYCLNISSSKIRKMLAFCTGDFRSCPVYRQKTAGTESRV